MLEMLVFSLLLLPAEPSKPCVIAKIHQKTGADKWRWTVPRPFEYVEGEFPAAAKFRHEISDKNVREIKQNGGRFVVLQDSYTLDELKDAGLQCARQEQ